MDPKVLLDYINIWYEDPNTPLDDLKLPPGISHMVATFINEAKWKEQQAKQAKVAKLKKEKFLRQNLLNLTPDDLVSTQAELKTLTDKYSKLSDLQSLKSSFIKLATHVVNNYNKKATPPVPTPQPLIEEPADETAHAEEIPQGSRVDEPAIEEITMENPADESATTSETDSAPAVASKPADESVPAAASKPADDSALAGSSKPADENVSAEKTPSPKASKPSFPHEETTQGSAAPADESGSITKQAEEEQSENPQADESHSPEQNPQPENQADPTPPPEQDPQAEARDEPIPPLEENPQQDAPVDDIPQPEAQPDPIPQPEAQQENAPQPEAQADEIPHPEDHAEENALDPDNAFVVLNPESAIVVSPEVQQQNLQPMQHQPFSKRSKFQKESLFEERMFFIGENPYDKPRIRHLKFWTRTQLNYYASVLCGRSKIFQHRHIPHVGLEEISCLTPVLNALHEAGLLPMCSDICDWNSELILQFYATLHISGDPTDINT
ncbi:hypothetical protein ZWY2020_059035 [Hordeum vulgare]|nr:hypothetical protein ZWY2020_059035 [Hordeum vulgare]